MEPVRIDLHIHYENTDNAFCIINQKLDRLLKQGETIMADLSGLTAQVTASTSVEQSAITLINGLAAQIAAAGTDPVALAALQSQLNASATSLAQAISANTPVTQAQAQARA